MDTNETKGKILEATIDTFNEKGLKFTMDDIAKDVGMSKKTIYMVFNDKKDLFNHMVDYCFDSIKESEQEILDNPALSTVEKIRSILGVMPDRYKNIDLRKLYILKDKYPDVFAHVAVRLENDWEPTINLLKQGIAEGSIRDINIPLFKVMLEAAIEQFFQRDVLVENHMTYNEGLSQVVSILVDGIVKK